MTSNNFLIFNENKKNMLSDTAYDSDNQRKNGLEPGMARSALMNKVLYQITSVCSSIAQFLASKGYNVEENADSLYNCISDLLSNKIVDDTTSLNEGIYRNLLLDANISDDINNCSPLSTKLPSLSALSDKYHFISAFESSHIALM